MASFLFSPANSENLSTGTYYAHLVTSVPNTSATTVADINYSDAIGYQPQLLTGLVNNTLKWTFNDFIFPAYTYNTIVVGIVVAKRLSNNFFSSDPILYYSDIQNVLLQPVSLTTGKYTISIKFPIDGIIIYNSYYQYNSGAYANTEPLPKGLMYLLGTRNNTQSFLTPLNNSVLITHNGTPGIENYFFDRIITNDATNPYSQGGFNFGSRRIRVGTVGIYSAANINRGLRIYGSNTTPDITPTNLNNPALWTFLASTPTSNLGIGYNFATTTNTTYWQYLKVEHYDVAGSLATAHIGEIEFYDSSMYSTNENLMSTVIDSPFRGDLLDKSGWGHTWTNNNTVILDNSLFLNGSATTVLSQSPLFNLTNRNFNLSLEVRLNNIIQASGILNWDIQDYPLSMAIYNNNYSVVVGTNTDWLYLYNGNGIFPIAARLTSEFDKLSLDRTLSIFTTTINNGVDNIYPIVASGSVGNANGITLGRNALTHINGYVKNLKLIT